MPQLAESVVSATVSKWLKQPGDRIEEYEPICEVITDKVTVELPSTGGRSSGGDHRSRKAKPSRWERSSVR